MLPAMTIFVAAAHALALNGHMMRPAAARGMQPRTAARRPSMVSLPFGGGGAASSGPSEEVLASYRLMGPDIDASYDEIEVVFNDLLEQYQKEPKRKIKLQVAKDKILDDRLRVAMSSKSGFAADPFAWKGPKPPRFTIPPALQGVMELPDKETLGKNAFVFGAIGLLPAITAAWASTSVGLGFAISLYLLYNRGVPDSGDMGADMRAPRPKPLLMATGITLLLGSIGATVCQLFYAPVARLLRFVTQELLIGIGAATGFFIAATLFKVRDEYD